jgi:polyketide cyclase/dehydrase/lipid transport protein
VARNEIHISATPDAVYDVLADARCYGVWILGSSTIRAADPEWPAPGTAFDHTVGQWPLRLADHTECVEEESRVRLRLRAHARPLPPADIELRLVPESDGTRVIMVEDIAPRLLRLALWPTTQPAVWLRNTESLRRLKALAEGRIPRPTEPLPPRGT